MRAFIFTAATLFVKSPLIDAYHAEMFHGDGWRENMPDSCNRPSEEHPLMIKKNVYNLAHVFKPDHTWGFVACEPLCRELSAVTRLHPIPVRFTKLFCVPYREGDFSHFQRHRTYWALMRSIRAQRHDPALEKQVPPYFEIPASVWRWRSEFAETLDPIRVELTSPAVRPEWVEVKVHPAVLKEHPLYCSGAWVCREDVFRIIAPHVNWNYFLWGSVDIPG